MERTPRSCLAHLSAGLGLLAVLGVLCFHFPEQLTSRDFRAVYSEQFARHLLLVGLVAAFVLGTLAILRNRDKRVALVGVVSAAVAVVLGGAMEGALTELARQLESGAGPALDAIREDA